MVVKVDRLSCSLGAVLAGGTEPKRSVMVTVVKALVYVVVRGQLQLTWTSVTVEGSPETVASGGPVVVETSVWTLVTVAGSPETVAS